MSKAKLQNISRAMLGYSLGVAPPSQFGNALCLGLDLGTNCGYAFTYYPTGKDVDPIEYGSFYMGQLDLSLGPYDSGSVRPARLRHFLEILRPRAVFMEDVKFVPPMVPGMKFNPTALMARAATSMEMFGVLKHCAQEYGDKYDIPVVTIPIGTIKKYATGSGNANKEAVIKAANEKFGIKLDPKSYASTGVDNVADAAFVLLAGLDEYRCGITQSPHPARRKRVKAQTSNTECKRFDVPGQSDGQDRPRRRRRSHEDDS